MSVNNLEKSEALHEYAKQEFIFHYVKGEKL